MTKEEARQSLFNTKVYVDGKSKEIQEKLFELGFKWIDNTTDICFLKKPFLFFDNNGYITYMCDMEYFANSEYKEVSAAYILNLKWDKEISLSEEIDRINKECLYKGFYPYRFSVKMSLSDKKRYDDMINFLNKRAQEYYEYFKSPIDKNWSKPKTASDLKPFDRCLVCSGKGCVWVPEIYGYKSDDGKHHLIGHSVSSEHVIPYDESLRGKLYNKEDESHE